MSKRNYTKLIQEGKYVAEVDVELIENDDGWSPFISVEDAYKLDDVRDALKRGDIKKDHNSAVFLALRQLPFDFFGEPIHCADDAVHHESSQRTYKLKACGASTSMRVIRAV